MFETAMQYLLSSSAWFAKVVRYGVIGVLATAVYGALTWVFIGQLQWPPVLASWLAFACAVPVSYLGHKHFSFNSERQHRVDLPRFVLTSSVGFSAGTLAQSAVQFAGVDYRLAIVATVVMVPMINFLIMNFWVFRTQKPLDD